jgi:hypothetical protein
MPDWQQLQHAYGEASDVPALLKQLSPDPNAAVWQELWSRICHQGTVYTASFAALPALLDTATGWPPRDRPMVLSLAAAIVSSSDVAGSRDELMRGLERTVAAFERLGHECLADTGLSDEDFVYVAQAVLAFQGDMLWGSRLDLLVSGEFEGECSSCRARLALVIGEYGFFTTSEEWVNRPSTKRVPIMPADAAALSGVARWLHDEAARSGHVVVARWVQHLFGVTACPACASATNVEDAIRRAV